MKIAMVSLSPLCMYAGRRIKPGEVFEANGASDARVLIAIGRADFAPALPTPEPLPEPVVIPQWPETQDEPAPKPKRQYKRRDMTAED